MLADAAVFVAWLALPLDDAALLLALALWLRGGRLALDMGASTVADSLRTPGGSIMSTVLVVDDRSRRALQHGAPARGGGLRRARDRHGRDASAAGALR